MLVCEEAGGHWRRVRCVDQGCVCGGIELRTDLRITQSGSTSRKTSETNLDPLVQSMYTPCVHRRLPWDLSMSRKRAAN